MSTLYIMSGIPFSGKSTLSKAIAKYSGAVRISWDELWVELEDANHLPVDKSEAATYVTSIAEQRMAILLKSGKDVVYDNLGHSKDWRNKARKIADKAQAESFVVYLDTPIEEAKKREQENMASGERHTVDAENFRQAVANFEIPREDERVLRFGFGSDVQEWLGRNIAKGNNNR